MTVAALAQALLTVLTDHRADVYYPNTCLGQEETSVDEAQYARHIARLVAELLAVQPARDPLGDAAATERVRAYLYALEASVDDEVLDEWGVDAVYDDEHGVTRTLTVGDLRALAGDP